MPKRTYQDIWSEYSQRPESDIDRHFDELKQLGTPEAEATIDLLHASAAINTGDSEVVIERANKAAHAYDVCGDRSYQSRALSFIGITHFYSGNVVEAYEQWVRARALIDDLDVPSQKATFDINFGNVFNSAGDMSRAIESYRSALERFESVGDVSGAADALTLIGNTYQDNGEVQESIEPFTRSIDLKKQAGVENGGGQALMNLAISYAMLGMIKEARQIHLQITDDDKSNTIISLGSTFCEGLISEAEGDTETAVATFVQAEKLAIERGYREIEMLIIEKLRDCALKQNDLPRYVEYNQRHQGIEKTIRGSEVAVRVATHSIEQEMQQERVERDKERALLYGALPESVANRMLSGEDVSGDHFDDASILFLDISDFTTISDKIPPGHVVHLLKAIFKVCDDVCNKHGLTKIKTIGDSYMAVGGAPEPLVNHVQRTAKAALEMLSTLDELELTMDPKLGDTSWTKEIGDVNVRIGLHCGPLVAGIVGEERLQYDVWGDSVNVASRMESSGEAGKIHVSEAFADSLQGKVVKRGAIDIKGKGSMTTYWLEGA